MGLLKKGMHFLDSQMIKIGVVPGKIIWMQLVAKFLPFAKWVPRSIIEKICLKSQTEIIDFLEKRIDVDVNAISDTGNKQIPKIVWVMWLQGIEAAPFIVQQCNHNLHNFAENNNFKIHQLSETNIQKFIDIPERITNLYKTHKLSGANYSDYCRCALLAKYGGIWIDSTVFIKKNVKVDFNESTSSGFFSVRNENKEDPITNISRHRWNTSVLGAEKNSQLFVFCVKFLNQYYEKFDINIDYLLIDYVMHIAYEKITKVRQSVDYLKKNNIEYLWLDKNANKPYSERKWQGVSVTTFCFKLSNRNKYLIEHNRMLGHLVDEEELKHGELRY
ncbi:capsular polysaccharide synthesis protein [Pediococcus inopinatus]|uniref:capsular polysaccharide synthesis protein n=1 Tax=Pediococcus inopinatus TaxID=114090 RepID=UPI002A6B811E|nr:capsular polysaccharide synthesis protein [Pediococcus inopinatus]WPP08688.1 capsular polysaccharide synthesis protein [Pediococcus inopinatus]